MRAFWWYFLVPIRDQVGLCRNEGRISACSTRPPAWPDRRERVKFGPATGSGSSLEVTSVFGTSAAAPIGASTLLERTGSMAVTHGAARYRGYASPVVQPTESRRLLQAWVKGKTPATWCAFHSPEVGSLVILVQLVCCDIVSGPSAGALMSLIPSPLLVARDSGSLKSSVGNFAMRHLQSAGRKYPAFLSQLTLDPVWLLMLTRNTLPDLI